MLLVSITNDHTLKSRMMGNYQVRFGSGGGEGDLFANHNHQELSKTKHLGSPSTPAMAARLTDHVWSICELLRYRIAPLPWGAPAKGGRPKKPVESIKRASTRPRVHLREGVLCSFTA